MSDSNIIRFSELEFSYNPPENEGDRFTCLGIIKMENGAIFRKSVCVGAVMESKRTTAQVAEFAHDRILDFANRLTIDASTGSWLFDGKPME